MYKVYVKTDVTSRIISVNSDAFLPDTDGWEQIDEGDGDKYHHAQGNYLPQPIMTAEGVPCYKLADGKAVERTAEEIQEDIDAIPPPPPDPLVVTQKAATVMFRAAGGGGELLAAWRQAVQSKLWAGAYDTSRLATRSSRLTVFAGC